MEIWIQNYNLNNINLLNLKKYDYNHILNRNNVKDSRYVAVKAIYDKLLSF